LSVEKRTVCSDLSVACATAPSPSLWPNRRTPTAVSVVICDVTGAAVDGIDPEWRATVAARRFGDRS